MPQILVVANETVGGRALLEEVRKRAESDDARFHLVVPQRRPRHGSVIYDDAARNAAQVRVDLAVDFLREVGIQATGEVGDEDPFQATMDAYGELGADEVIVSTHPASVSGWLRRDLVERIEDEVDCPVTHVVTDVESDGLVVDVTLAVANRTAESPELEAALAKRRSHEGDRRQLVIVVVPMEGKEGRHASRARVRLLDLLQRLRQEGLLTRGMVGDPDPYTATMNALDLFHVNRVVISTLPDQKSGWMRGDLVGRVRNATNAEVEHVVSDPEKAVA
jgi:hypothetical protein